MNWIVFLFLLDLVIFCIATTIRQYCRFFINEKEMQYGVQLERIVPYWVEFWYPAACGCLLGSGFTYNFSSELRFFAYQNDGAMIVTNYLYKFVLLLVIDSLVLVLVAYKFLRTLNTVDDRIKRLCTLNEIEKIYLSRQDDVMKRINEMIANVNPDDIVSIKRILAESNQPGMLLSPENLNVDFTSGIIGRGGSGLVLKGMMGGTKVALKMIQEQMAGDALENIENEL